MDAPSGQPFVAAKPADFATGRPLAPFEHLMLIDDRPGHPMCFYVECMVHGPLRENRLREAVLTAARRHPAVHSRVGDRGGRAVWVASDVPPEVVWNPPANGADPWRRFDLRHGSGVRLVVLGDGERSYRVVMQVHHSVCDGIAACEFFGDIWAVYAGAEPRAFSSGRAARLPSGENVSRPPPAAGGHDIARETWALASFWPTALACVTHGSDALQLSPGSTAGPEADPRSPPYQSIEFDRSFTARLRAAAAVDSVSLNDMIVAATMRAAIAWNTRAGRRHGNVRITMPVNLRKPGQREPASNDLGYAFLDRKAAECATGPSLAVSIAAATRWILDNNAATVFLVAVGFLARWPALLWLTTRLPVCISTAVVSNVGDPSRRMRSGVGRDDGRDAPDDLVIEGFIGVPPLRPRTRAAIGVTTYAGRLSLCCLCSAHPDPHTGARLFLDLVARELAALADAADVGSEPIRPPAPS